MGGERAKEYDLQIRKDRSIISIEKCGAVHTGIILQFGIWKPVQRLIRLPNKARQEVSKGSRGLCRMGIRFRATGQEGRNITTGCGQVSQAAVTDSRNRILHACRGQKGCSASLE